MKKIFLILSLFHCVYGISQNVGIGTTTPDASAILDVSSTSKGLLIPRMTTSAMNNISNPAKGLLVMDTITNQLMMFFGSSPTDWRTVIYNSGWSLTGNSNLNPATSFIGTSDNSPIQFRINNLYAGQLHPVTGNVFIGLKAGQNNTIGYSNIALGSGALFNNTKRNNVVAIGDSALYNNGLGALGISQSNYNTAIGSKALYSNTTGFNNTANGYQALNNNTIGAHNSAIGAWTLINNTIGMENTAIGTEALFTNSTGNLNTAAGSSALFKNSIGEQNTAIGARTLFDNTNGIHNTAVGTNALYSNTTGAHNSANGSEALYSNNIGSQNTAFGHKSLFNNSSGFYNVAMGYRALYNNATADFNTAIGFNAGTEVGFYYNTISIGNNGYLNAASNQAFLGGLSTVWNGGNMPWSTFSDARIKTNINEDVKGLDFITRLRPVTYYRNIKAATEITGNKETPDFPGKYDVEKIKESGFLAQEVEQAAKESGYNFSGITIPKKSTELYTLSYEQFVVPLVKAVQEQQSIIINQQNKIEQLEMKIKAMEKLFKKQSNYQKIN